MAVSLDSSVKTGAKINIVDCIKQVKQSWKTVYDHIGRKISKPSKENRVNIWK